MRRISLLLFSMFLFAGFASAQLPSANVFFGYSYYNTDIANTGSGTSTNGWEASVEGKVIPFLGFVADFDSHYGSQTFNRGICPVNACSPPSNDDFTENNFLFGPRVSVSVSRFRPFAEALFGVARVNVNNGIGSDTSLATAVGGGLDYKIIKPIAWRIQGDYVHTSFFSTDQNNVRISTGIVVRF